MIVDRSVKVIVDRSVKGDYWKVSVDRSIKGDLILPYKMIVREQGNKCTRRLLIGQSVYMVIVKRSVCVQGDCQQVNMCTRWLTTGQYVYNVIVNRSVPVQGDWLSTGQYKHLGLVTVAREWILDSIGTHHLQPLADYVFNTCKDLCLPFWLWTPASHIFSTELLWSVYITPFRCCRPLDLSTRCTYRLV